MLTRDGTFLLYDFSPPRRSVSGGDLERWFASFEQRFPWPPGWEPFDVRELPLVSNGLRLLRYADVEARLPMTFDAYLRYMLSETNARRRARWHTASVTGYRRSRRSQGGRDDYE